MYEGIIFDRYFNGEKNFMTPNVIGYSSIKMDNEYLVVEFSEGRGIFDTYLFGVSCLVFNPQTRETQKINLSKAFKSANECKEYVKSISLADFQEAGRYGEIKIC